MIRTLIPLALLAGPAVAEWSYVTEPTEIATSAPVQGVTLAVYCGVGEPSYHVDGFFDHTGATAFLIGDEIEDVYPADCRDGFCTIGFEGGEQTPARLLATLRDRATVDVLEYRARPVGEFDLTGSAAALAELAAMGCDLP